MKPRQKRLFAILATLAGVGVAVAIILIAFEQNLLYYVTPSELHVELLVSENNTQNNATNSTPAKKYHLGGMVKQGSVLRTANSLNVTFVLTDYEKEVPVSYSGILPDLFREGQGIIAIGSLQADGSLKAEKVLAKHDENYMPPKLDKDSMNKKMLEQRSNSSGTDKKP
ncbi:MAG: cytochrome c maturation protein CcmE [Gammaproteobacteria bacterium]|nr:cytochrome c maturation protein CcmE [Gammaproteobacteria bacterium]NNC98105.1 cytochrome c maturation protein CcmE [Gammaproteobacteria bacterium]NNM13169.1 cytochrome c maturation protein CcmE [Gammaproteobacteria bacterium]